jgi:hypothetical protein
MDYIKHVSVLILIAVVVIASLYGLMSLFDKQMSNTGWIILSVIIGISIIVDTINLK